MPLEMKKCGYKKEVQRLTERVATLNHFMSRAVDKMLPFIQSNWGSTNFEWTKECETFLEPSKQTL